MFFQSVDFDNTQRAVSHKKIIVKGPHTRFLTKFSAAPHAFHQLVLALLSLRKKK